VDPWDQWVGVPYRHDVLFLQTIYFKFIHGNHGPLGGGLKNIHG